MENGTIGKSWNQRSEGETANLREGKWCKNSILVSEWNVNSEDKRTWMLEMKKVDMGIKQKK